MSKSKLADNLVGDEWEGYMDATDFVYEQGRPREGNSVFANVDALRDKDTHGCGIVKVKVELIEWVELPTAEGLKFADQEKGKS